ncbi:MAG: hypothetical protein QG657_1872 [Acidobacteriota bacterium]|nr:hypothetical protein [Acidobacteriota bacterium]
MKTFRQFLKEQSDAEKPVKKVKSIEVKPSMLQNNYNSRATNGDDPKKRWIDRIFFNREEDYEVIPMIQRVVNYFKYTTEEDVRKVEYAISKKPGNIRGQENVFNWLKDYLS